MKKRVLSGIQPSGKLHLGNYFGMIKRMVAYQDSTDLFCFVANLHSLTTLQNQTELRTLTLQAAMDLLALGIDPEKCHFWVQSDVPEVTELMWILSCLMPMGLAQRAHSYKDKIAKGIEPSLGLLNYPVLMAADVLLIQSQVVPVGKDQKQHLEMTRDLAIKFNQKFGETFVVPEVEIPEVMATIPGTDGQKMSKSYGNTIPIFGEEKDIKKAVMGIVTDSKEVDDPKDPETCNVFSLYKLFASEAELTEMEAAYRKGGIGYGEAKKKLHEKMKDTFVPFQEKRKQLESDHKQVEEMLQMGANKVRNLAVETLEKVREATGLKY